MPALRVKVENSGQPATRVELPADAVYQEALASILGAVGLQQGVLSLNKKEPVNLGPQDRMFQGDAFRPGDLVWVVVADQVGESAEQGLEADCVTATDAMTAPDAQAQQREQNSEERVPTMDAGPAFAAACTAIRAVGGAVRATTICGCLVQSCFLDSGCTATRCPESSPEQQAEEALDTSECFQREFTFPALTTNQTVKLVIFHMGHQQIVYTSLPGSGFGHRQLVFESKHFEGSASLSPAVLASTYSAVRDRLFTWAVNACLLKAGKQQGLGLMALPGEALCQIIANLPRGDVAVTASVCKRLSACASDDSVWRQVYFNEFNEELPDGKDPIPAFQTQIVERNRLRNALNQQRRPGGYRGPVPHGLYIPPYRLPPPGIIGGNYDRLPGRIWLPQWLSPHGNPGRINNAGNMLASGGVFGGGGRPFGGMGRAQGGRTGGGRIFI